MSKLIRRMVEGGKEQADAISTRAKRLLKSGRGMEALQAVILVGIAFFILWGVQKIWNTDVKDAFKNELVATATGADKSSQGSGATTGGS